MTIRRLAATLLSTCALVAVAAPPAPAASELFVQTAASATSTAPKHGRVTLTLRDTPATVLAFDDRPVRRSRRLVLDRYLALWRQDFRTDPPNAALVGTRDGRRSQTVVELLGARRIRGGVRYTVRSRGGTPPRRLRDVSLFVDPYTTINALHFPMQTPSTAFEDIVITAGAPLVLAPEGGAMLLVVGSLTFQPGGVFQARVSEMHWTLPAGQGAALAAAATPKPSFVTSGDAGDVVAWDLEESTTVLIAPVQGLALGQAIIAAAP